MGASPFRSTPRLCCAALFLVACCIIFLADQCQLASAESKVDSDLVFDNLDRTHYRSDENHHRISRESTSEELTDSSPEADGHWLSSTVNRIKRSIGSLFSKSSDTEKHHSHHIAKVRKHRQAGELDDYEYEEEGQVENEEYEEEAEADAEENDYEQLEIGNQNEYDDDGFDVEDVPRGSTTNEVPIHRGDVGFDDDDDLGSSGEEPSGLQPTTTEAPILTNVPVYFRAKINIHEPFRETFNDRNSPEFTDVGDSVARAVEDIYRETSGTQTAQIISIQRVESDAFSSRVVVDIQSNVHHDEETMRNILLHSIQSTRRLGKFTANPEGFQFRAFEASRLPSCDEYELTCRNGQCVPKDSRCDRKFDCQDHSDEEGCPIADLQPTTITPERELVEISEEVVPEFVPRITTTTFEATVTTTTTTETTTPFEDVGSGDGEEVRCRADDTVRCEDGSRVICADHICDGHPDCDDGGDEINCKHDCAEGEFMCDISRCIPVNKRCDGVSDCDDGTDEHGCLRCGQNEMKCDDRCATLCNGVSECNDGADERDCPDAQCPSGMFSCGRGLACIDDRQRCDGRQDCPNNIDEQNCTSAQCPGDQFRCNTGVCLDSIRRCDGYSDCPAGDDELGCPGSGSQNVTTCEPDSFRCDDGECIRNQYKCDSYEDCRDGSDEVGCSALCNEGEFECAADGRCIPEHSQCDGRNDCSDGSDELDCPPPVPEPCQSNEFRCQDGTCIPIYLQCNGQPECPDRSDESECPCVGQNKFPCLNGQCIDSNLRCNRRNDCSDGSDEINCPTEPPYVPPEPTTPRGISCPAGQQPCQSGNQCILRSQLCDGRADCYDLSDETSCQTSSEGLNLRTYPNSQEIKENREVVFQCRDEGPLRARVHWTRPSGQSLPPGSRDLNGRLEIPDVKVEHSGTYICEALGYHPSTPGAQVSVQLNVDKWIPPPTSRPPTACGLQEATCSNGDCIPKNLVCDGRYDCTDGSDENRCNPNGCEPNEFRCSNKKCVLKTWKCDGDDDCGDGSDESECATNPPGSLCQYHQFACHSNNQCIPKSYHCDKERDCVDGSDEIGCAAPVISKPPPPMVNLGVGFVFEITCTAVGVPTPEVVWRLNWGHTPNKCSSTSADGFGTLTCPDIQIADQGAYSCEAINIIGTKFAVPDTILVVTGERVCQEGYFNAQARSQSECIPCFCFGQTTSCRSADLFIFQFQPPFDSLGFVGVRIDPITQNVEIRENEPIYPLEQPVLSPVGQNGLNVYVPPYSQIGQQNFVPYFKMPENYHGNQLKSYGGYLRYKIEHANRGYSVRGPDVILTGNGYTLIHESRRPHSGREDVEVRFFLGDWLRRSDSGRETMATREDIMMALEHVDNILIKLQYTDEASNTTVYDINMDSAAVPDTGSGPANYVEQCSCPVGYSGNSCERCANGFVRHKTGPWLGQCKRAPEECPPGTYGDPRRGGVCEPCPCPLTTPSNQFARTCSPHPAGGVICHCAEGYVGLRCESCAPGYTGNPQVPGDSCRAIEHRCSPDGALSVGGDDRGVCRCKLFADGPTCDTCKPNTFHLSADNQFGCIACFCMGVTSQCTSSSWYRDKISTTFTHSRQDFTLVDTENRAALIAEGIRLIPENREIAYSNFPQSGVYYWSLPPRYLGNKLTSYGGYLRYTLKYVPGPGGQSSRNSAADVELVSDNNINLLYFAREQVQPSGTPQTFVVPLLEQYWQRQDGQRADREHLLMALADLKAIYIKATYNTNTREASLISVSLDTANEYNTGSVDRALSVEQCYCPPEYTGLSCENCAVGFTRGEGGLYLGICEPCDCNGHSNECDPETGVCRNCKDHTTGDNCELCEAGYQIDPTTGRHCIYSGSPSVCNCDSRGAASNECYNGVCQCKPNVEGNNCDRCRPGTFGLNASNIDGCSTCFCSGVSNECSGSNLYIEQIPSQIFDPQTHGFTLTDPYQRQRIAENFDVNGAMNEIGFNFLPSNSERWYWSLPTVFTRNQLKSYGGRLEFTQRYTERPQARYTPDQDIIIIGNGITIYWSNPNRLHPNIINKLSVVLSPRDNWQRLDQTLGPRPASREDILTALSNIQVILIRATLSTDTASSFLSDISLDTAVEQYTPQGYANSVEVCRCPPGYRGTSCESCAPGHYRDSYDLTTGPLGSCARCPCSNNERSCELGSDQRVMCNCLPGFSGGRCEYNETRPTPPPGPGEVPTSRPPTIQIEIIAPSIEIFEVGSSVRFNCSARSVAAPRRLRVHWSKIGDDLPDRAIDDGRGILVITDLRISDSGRYVCEASDGFTIETKDTVLRVGETRPESPRVAISPPYVDVYEGQGVDVHCAASGSPAPNLRLVRVDGQALNRDHSFSNGYFRIPNALRSDEGEYQCIAENSVGTDSSSFTIYVRQQVGTIVRVSIQPSYYTGNSGETVMLRCVATGNIESIRWSRENGDLPYNSREDRGTLMILDARPEDSGRYVCRVSSYSGTSGSQTAQVSISDQQVGEYPTVSVSPERITISQGSSLELRCNATGIPTPSIKWTKLGTELGTNSEQIGSILHIRNARFEDRGVYVCVSTNEHGLAQASTIVEVNRLESPVLTIHPDASQIIVAGNSAILQCRATAGIPSPRVTWRRGNGRQLSSNIEVMSEGTLRFTQITPNEEGDYICTGENEAGSATAIANIVVHTIPDVWIVPDQEIITKKISDYLRLECHGSGNPEPTVVWSKYTDTENVMSARTSLTNIAIHEIRSVTQQDEGLYICRGMNRAGTVEKRIQLVVDTLPTRGDITGNRPGEDATSGGGGYKDNEPPRRPYQPPTGDYDKKFTAPVGTRAEIRCQINNLESRPVYVNWVRADNTSLPDKAFVRGGTLYIDEVQPSAAGKYLCLGIDRGSGQEVFSLGTYLEVISPPRITLTPQKQVVHPGDNAYIQCTATGEQPIQITWSPIGRSMPASVYTREGYIRFNNIQLDDAGRYLCKATNNAGEADAVAEVIVEASIHKPFVTAENKEQTAPLGSSVTLRCIARNMQNPNNIRWYRQDLALPANSRVNGEYIHIFNLRQEDQGRYYCEIPTESGYSSDYINLQISSPNLQPRLEISQPDDREYRISESVDLICQSTEPGAITSWSKLAGWFAPNVQSSGGTLRINRITNENIGVYRCEATGRQGVYHKDYTLHVNDEENLKDEEAPVQTKSAARGSTVLLDCRTDLEQPVTYLWSKQGGDLPSYIDVYGKTIQLNDIGSSDAGTYMCSASNDQRTIDVPIILVVTGIVPYFPQAPTSYIALPTLADAYIQFNFEISFKPQRGEGLILYNGNKGNEKTGDYIALSLVNSVPEFRFNLGYGTATVSADHPISNGQWHTVKIVRNRKKVTMYVDGEGPYIGNADGKYIGLDLSEPLYLGGVPDFTKISPETNAHEGFVGCISRLKIGHAFQDVLREAINKDGVTSCETCAENKCQNQGVCQEALSNEGYTCICHSGFSGPTCNKLKGEACSPYACGSGRCIDNENSFQCLCPLGKVGRRCEREITINEPAFMNDAYIAYPTPKPQRRFKTTLKIKPRDANDGILLYCGETEEGHGDFASLAVKDRHLEFRFDVGNGPTIIRSADEVVPGQWTVLTASRSLSEGRMIVNGGVPVIGRTPGNHKTLNLLTPMYVGGYDKHRMKVNQGVGVTSGFNGCISDVDISGMDLSLIHNVTEAANVEDCSTTGEDVDNSILPHDNAHDNEPRSAPFDSSKTGCTSSPCRNNGVCYPLSPVDYLCNCPEGFSGKDCKNEANSCDKSPCQNGGTCNGNSSKYTCDCLLGYTGLNCEQRTELRNDVHFDGNGYLEFSRSLLNPEDEEGDVIALELSTNSSNGLIFWHGQTPNEDGQGKDYSSLAIVNGYLEFSYDLGSGPAIVTNDKIRVDDGQRHSVILKRKEKEGSIEVDHAYVSEATSDGLLTSMNAEGNVYLGGTPNMALMTAGRYTQGFNGCIHQFELQNSKSLDLGAKAINGLNAKPCSSYEDDNNIWNSLVN